MAEEQGANKLLTNCPPALYLIFRAGAGVDAGVGRAYGVRDFDFYKVFSRAFGEEEDGAGGSSNGRHVPSPTKNLITQTTLPLISENYERIQCYGSYLAGR